MNVKSSAYTLATAVARLPLFGSAVRPVARFANYMQFVRQQSETAATELRLLKRFPTLTVGAGPFSGMTYATADSAGSTLLPKLFGCYESELHSAIEALSGQQYDLVVDIGCAEGYYAVGFALRFEDTPVVAYDIDERARSLCASLAAANGVHGRIDIRGECTPDDLAELIQGKRCLIMSDCEGYEEHLFSEVSSGVMDRCDLIIEIHDFGVQKTSQLISDVFSNSHRLEVRRSLPTVCKAESPDARLPEGLTPEERQCAVAEKRPNQMDWFILTSRSVADESGSNNFAIPG